MNIERYKPNGYKDTSRNLTPAAADTIYNAHLPMVQTPFAKYYRIVVTGDGGRIIRDTDHEIFGRQTITPGTLMYAGSAPTPSPDAS